MAAAAASPARQDAEGDANPRKKWPTFFGCCMFLGQSGGVRAATCSSREEWSAAIFPGDWRHLRHLGADLLQRPPIVHHKRPADLIGQWSWQHFAQLFCIWMIVQSFLR